MPTVLLIDCSLNMAERFPFVIKQNDQMETTINIEKRSLNAKFVESLMSHNRTPTKLESIAVIFFAGADTIKIIQHFTRNTEMIVKSVQKIPILGDYSLKPALDFAKKYMTTVFGSQRSQKIFVFTDSSHRDEDFNGQTTTGDNNEMDVDLRDNRVDQYDEIIPSSHSQTEVTYICVKKPSGTDRTRIENITKRSQCSFSKIYWLINREKESSTTITNEMIQNLIDRVRNDHMNVFFSTVKCGHHESQLAVYPAIKSATLQATGEILQPSNTLTVNGFIELSSIRSPMTISKHILLPIQRYQKAGNVTPMFATKRSAAGNNPSSSNVSSSAQKKINAANNFFYLLLISLKKEKSVALVSINDQWYGTIHCQKFDRKKKSSRLILSVFEPGDCIPWIPSFERLGPYALVFPAGNNGEFVYKKQPWRVKVFPRSYTETFLIWCRQNNFQNDINKFIRNSAKLPDKINVFHRELNKICRGAFIYGLRERLFQLLQKLFQRQIEAGKIKPEGIKHIKTAIVYMNRLCSSDRYIKFEDA